ncbi:hypothetical protein TNCV_4716091 [Trichonephila clavipes]|nr:hypothetical protein TNCV_4716091 [Trichonephila clavipes]
MRFIQFGLGTIKPSRRRFVMNGPKTRLPLFLIQRILFSDSALRLNGYVNKQTAAFESDFFNPQVYVETPLHPEN